jgi:hypothetical protein
MGKTVNRVSAVSFLIAVSAALVPPSANAETADPALAGSCAGTIRADSGEALTLDAGAPVNAAGEVTVGTGTNSARTGDERREPLVSLPVADAAQNLRVGELPVVGDPATDVLCSTAQNTVNTLSAATESLISGEQKDPPPAARPPATPPGTPPSVPAPPAPQPPGGVTPVQPGAGNSVVFPVLIANPLGATVPESSVSTELPLGGVAPAAPGLNPPSNSIPPEVIAQNSGTAEALPAPSATPARLPLLIAVFALAVVAAALVRSWMRRKSA